VKGYALQAANAERRKPVVVLEPSELALYRSAASVERAPPLRLARDKGVQARRLPPEGLRIAVARWAAPLGRFALEISARECPDAVFAGRGQMVRRASRTRSA
jgi:hypothetical protein